MTRDRIAADLEAGLHHIPPHLREGLRAYFLDRLPTGDFLRAVLENDFAGAVLRADPITERWLPSIAKFLHNDTPPRSHGSPAAVAAWLACTSKIS